MLQWQKMRNLTVSINCFYCSQNNFLNRTDLSLAFLFLEDWAANKTLSCGQPSWIIWYRLLLLKESVSRETKLDCLFILRREISKLTIYLKYQRLLVGRWPLASSKSLLLPLSIDYQLDKSSWRRKKKNQKSNQYNQDPIFLIFQPIPSALEAMMRKTYKSQLSRNS